MDGVRAHTKTGVGACFWEDDDVGECECKVYSEKIAWFADRNCSADAFGT